MPQRHAGVKDLRKNFRNRMRNLDVKTELRKTIKTFLSAVTSKDKTAAESNLKIVYKKLDKAAKRNIISKNTASRRKSRFTKLLTKTIS